MKAVSQTTIDYFNSLMVTRDNGLRAILYTITLPNGDVYRYNSSDTDLTVGGNLFQAAGPHIEGGRMRATLSLEVDQDQLKIYADNTHLIAGKNVLGMIRKGLFLNALVKVDKIWMPTWGDVSLNPVNRFTGWITEVSQLSASTATMSMKSGVIKLERPVPRNVLQAECRHQLFDAGCTLVEASFTVSTSVQAGSNQRELLCTLAALPAGQTYEKGKVKFTSGQNTGIITTIAKYAAGAPAKLTLTVDLPYTINVGETFTAVVGCARNKAACDAFTNFANYGGELNVPVPETVL